MFVYKLSGCGFVSCCSHLNFRFLACFEQGVLDIQATMECGFIVTRVREMIIRYTQIYRTDKYSQHSSIIWPVLLNCWEFLYELSGCGFESRCSDLYFRFRACFEQGVPWHPGNYKVWIQSETHLMHRADKYSHNSWIRCETRTWHDNNIQSNAPYR